MREKKVLELKATFKGQVQGVFFRRTVQKHALSLALTGYARNLANGDVEVTAQGTKEDLERLLEAVKKDPGKARIDSIATSFKDPEKLFKHFETF